MKLYRDLYCIANEYAPVIKDKFDRVPSVLSNSNPLQPSISEFLYKEGFRPVYKEGKKYAVCISHDIDFLYEPKNKNSFFISALQSVKNKNWGQFVYNCKNLVGRYPLPAWGLNNLIDYEMKNNIKSSYYFLCLENGESDFNYDISAQKKVIQYLISAGYEIGLHGGHEAYLSIEKIADEKRKLEKVTEMVTKGYRNHYLRFKVPDTWHHLQNLGFDYDTTLGFPETLGYKNGLCYPFRPYDKINGCYIDILEIPLLVMDVSFFKYMGLTLESSLKLFQKIHEDVKKNGGVLSIVWHNNHLNGEYGILYDCIIKEIVKAEEAWVTTSLELATWWRLYNMDEMENIVNAKFLTK